MRLNRRAAGLKLACYMKGRRVRSACKCSQVGHMTSHGGLKPATAITLHNNCLQPQRERACGTGRAIMHVSVSCGMRRGGEKKIHIIA